MTSTLRRTRLLGSLLPAANRPRLRPGGLQLENGCVLTEDTRYLSVIEAREAASRLRVLVHGYRSPMDEITGDRARLDRELGRLQPQPRIGWSVALLHADAHHEVLVLERFA